MRRLEGQSGRAQEEAPSAVTAARRDPGGRPLSDADGERARGQPGLRMASTTTCTRFTDEYQLFEELGK